jgi:hypothetical protein
MKYEIKPIDSYVDRPAVIELIKAFGRGQLKHDAAQAAVWHLNNDIRWEELAAKRKSTRSPQPYFSGVDLRMAVQIAAESVNRAQLAHRQEEYLRSGGLSSQN